MAPAPKNTIDVRGTLERVNARDPKARGISNMARELVGSEILKIAAEIRAMLAQGAKILNLTVGDFSPKEFPIPGALADGVMQALKEGHTNYPPADGVLECREAVQELFKERLGLDYPIESVLIAGGSRPMIAGTYYALINPGDPVIYGLPSWNNNHYCVLSGAEGIEIPTRAEHGFFPDVESLAPHLSKARILCLNTPANPTGTVMDADTMRRISLLVVEENRRREAAGKAPIYLMFDQVYWMLTFHGHVHSTPVALVPEIAAYTIFIGGISKALAATGLRVGWAVGPSDVVRRMSAILTHIGAWAPRAEQIATARILRATGVMDQHLSTMTGELTARLDLLSNGIRALKQEGYEVDAIDPQGAIYLSMRIHALGKKTADGKRLATDEDVRKYLLNEAGIAVVPFQAFGLREDTGWFRASVGAVSKEDCASIGERLKRALSKLS
jgi:aspartate aminotransferase